MKSFRGAGLPLLLGLAWAQPVATAWSTDFAGSTVVDVEVAADGSGVVLGQTGSMGFLRRYSSTGALLWQLSLPGLMQNFNARDLVRNPRGGWYVLGDGPDSLGTDREVLVHPVSATGVLTRAWGRDLGRGGQENGVAGFAEPDGSLVVAARGTPNGQSQTEDAVFVKFSGAGTIVSSKFYNARSLPTLPAKLARDASGNYVISGRAGTTMFVWKVSGAATTLGATMFTYVHGIVDGMAFVNGLVTDTTNSVYVAGSFLDQGTRERKPFLMKLLTAGQFAYMKTARVAGATRQEAMDLLLSPSGHLWTTGWSQGSNLQDLILESHTSAGVKGATTLLNVGLRGIEQGFKLWGDAQRELYVAGVHNGEIALHRFVPSGALQFTGARKPPVAGAIVVPGASFELAGGDSWVVSNHGTTPFGSLTVFRQAPVAVADAYSALKSTAFTATVPVLANDRFARGSTLAVATAPKNGRVVLNANGGFTYTPNTGYVGTDTWSYRLTKPGLTPAVGTVTMTVR